jgi:hypothetical protein
MSWQALFAFPLGKRRKPGTKPSRVIPTIDQLESRVALSTLTLANGVLTYIAGASVANNLTITVSGGNYTFSETGEAITQVPSGWTLVDKNTATGPVAGVNSMSLEVGDLNDYVNASAVGVPTNHYGSTGNDTLIGGTANDDINGGDG